MRLHAVFTTLMAGLLASTSAHSIGHSAGHSAGHSVVERATTLETIPQTISRGLWVWNTAIVLHNNQTAELLNDCKTASITDLYVYMAPNDYVTSATAMATFITAATAASVRVWGLDGNRAYLTDGTGPQPLYNGITNLISYNSNQPAAAKFFGFQANVEPQDDGIYASFHNGIPDSALLTLPGTGVWQSTQAADREYLMRSWLTIHQTAQGMLHPSGLRFSGVMPFWADNYYGQPVNVTFAPSTIHQCVARYMMQYVDDFVIMSWNTDPANAAARVASQAAYASTLSAATQPRVYGSVEVYPGAGLTVSYADTPGKQSQTVVLADLQTITNTLSVYSAFHGMAIHNWAGWEALPVSLPSL